VLDFVNAAVSCGTVALNVALVAYLGFAASGRDGWLVRRAGRHGYHVALALAWLGVAGSLYYSEIAGWVPCDLCWWQRIALYPIAAVLAVAVARGEARRLSPYVAVLASFGALVAAYQIYLQFGPPAAAALMNGCSLEGGVSCSEVYYVAFGYVSMATSSLSAFIAILASLHLAHRAERHEANAAVPQ
jgi:disulfide bond formation protein DsbB